MKKILTIPLCLALLSGIQGCDNDNKDTISPLPDKTYTGAGALDIEYNGQDMNGKEAVFSQKGDEATITLGSQIDFGSLSQSLSAFPKIPGPGVLPGSPELQLPVRLTPDGDEYKFAGKGETEFVTYAYSGEVDAKKLEIDFENVQLKNKRLAATAWKPAPLKREGMKILSSPFHIVWESTVPQPVEGLDLTIEEMLNLLTVVPVIPVYDNTAYMSLAQALAGVLQSVGFNPDGNMILTYLSTNNGAAQFAQGPHCMVQYVPLTDNMLKLFVNPVDLVGQILVNNSAHPDLVDPFGRSTRAMDQTTLAILEQIVRAVGPMLSEGFPMQYTLSVSSLQIFLNSELLLPLIKGMVLPILADPQVQTAIMEKLKLSPDLQSYLPQIEKFMQMIPELIEATTRIEIGINLIKY